MTRTRGRRAPHHTSLSLSPEALGRQQKVSQEEEEGGGGNVTISLLHFSFCFEVPS